MAVWYDDPVDGNNSIMFVVRKIENGFILRVGGEFDYAYKTLEQVNKAITKHLIGK